MLLVQAVDTAAIPLADRAGGVWNMLSGAVQALVVRDLLDTSTAHRLLAPVVAALGPALAAGEGSDRMISVLVVDDSVVVRRLIVDALGGAENIEVVGTAANGLLAQAKIDQLKPDVITLDIEMPEMDGIAAVRELRKRHKQIPVIMFSTLSAVRRERDAGGALGRRHRLRDQAEQRRLGHRVHRRRTRAARPEDPCARRTSPPGRRAARPRRRGPVPPPGRAGSGGDAPRRPGPPASVGPPGARRPVPPARPPGPHAARPAAGSTSWRSAPPPAARTR